MDETELAENTQHIKTEIYNALKKVNDPEVGINIIDLGLIYKIEYSKNNGIAIEMTLSTKGCPMGDVIMNDIETVLNKHFPDSKHNVKLVWEPAWTADRVTADGKKALGLNY